MFQHNNFEHSNADVCKRTLCRLQNGLIKKWELEAYACCPHHLNEPLMTVHLWRKIIVIVNFCWCCEVQSEYFISASWHCPSNFAVQGGHVVCLVGRGQSASVKKRATKTDKLLDRVRETIPWRDGGHGGKYRWLQFDATPLLTSQVNKPLVPLFPWGLGGHVRANLTRTTVNISHYQTSSGIICRQHEWCWLISAHLLPLVSAVMTIENPVLLTQSF